MTHWDDFAVKPPLVGRQNWMQQAAELRKEGEARRQTDLSMYRAQRLEAIGPLTGVIAHDFDNLLMGLETTLGIVSRQISPGQPARRHIESMVLTTWRGARPTKQLLIFLILKRLMSVRCR